MLCSEGRKNKEKENKCEKEVNYMLIYNGRFETDVRNKEKQIDEEKNKDDDKDKVYS